MPMDTSQLRPEGVQAAIDFAKSAGCELEADTVDPQVSLISKDGDTIVATILGVHSPGGACELHACFGKAEGSDGIASDLVNKALMKVHGAGHRRCQISYHGPDETPADWPGAKWTGEAPAQSEPQPETNAHDEETPDQPDAEAA